MKKTITDFGEKIGGARKDLWRSRGLNLEDLEEMNDAERVKYAKRDSVWPLPNAKKMIDEGLDVFVSYWQRAVRLKVYATPRKLKGDSVDQAILRYIRIAGKVRDAAMAVKDNDDIKEFYKKVENYFDEDYLDFKICVDYSLANLKYSHSRLAYKMRQQNFPDGIPKKKGERKKNFVPPQLTSIERGGKDYRHGHHIDETIWQDQFLFRGVEFGNWMSQKDRQFSMDYCYDALIDLADALQINEKDIAFGGTLALAFGARGSSKASAHYEPLRQVINLTKMHGAGCTAHEWMHALDAKLAIFYDLDNKLKLASESYGEYAKLPKEFTDLVKALQHDATGAPTDFYRGSRHFDKVYAKDAFGYWSGPSEMLARAFACYVKDVLGVKSDYLIAHADCYVFEYENMRECAIPQGEEREIFDEMFDILFTKLKKDGLFHHESVHEGLKLPEPNMHFIAGENPAYDYDAYNEDSDGQLAFSF